MHDQTPPSDAFCHLYLAMTDEVVYRLDADSNLIYLNEAGHALLQLEPGSAYGKPWMAFIHEDDRARARDALREAACAGSTTIEFDGRVLGLHGVAVPLLNRLSTVYDAQGDPAGVAGVAHNLEEHYRLAAQLHQSQKLETIGMLAGGIAHDFNNMLAAILGYTELMLEDKGADHPDYRALSYIHTSTERAAALAKQLLLFSRRSGAELKPTPVGAVVEETLQILQRTLPKTVRIVAHTGDGPDLVMADRNRLQQALMNLCLNARDSMGRGGELRIEVERVGWTQTDGAGAASPAPVDHIRICVQDTGEGIAPEVLERIWEPFFTTKPSGEGTGLGLSVVKDIVRAHHGYIDVASRPGQGTSFAIYLPAAESDAGDQALAMAEPPGGLETILVVDDEPVLLDLLSDMLGSKGYSVLQAGSGAEALEYIRAVGDRIDLVISDNMMPGITGRQLAHELLRLQPGMRILVCSGFSPTRESELGEIDYVASYVQKPYQRRELLTRVREALDIPAAGTPS